MELMHEISIQDVENVRDGALGPLSENFAHIGAAESRKHNQSNSVPSSPSAFHQCGCTAAPMNSVERKMTVVTRRRLHEELSTAIRRLSSEDRRAIASPQA